MSQKDSKKSQEKGNNPPEQPSSAEGIVLESSGEAKLSYAETPPKAPEGKGIHRRRPLPPIPDAAPKRAEDEQNPDSSQTDEHAPE
jgi:hypothetical protein